MKSPELTVQLGFAQVREVILSSPDVPRFSKAVSDSPPGVVVYFDEGNIAQMSSCAEDLKKCLEEEGKKVRLIHYQQLLPETDMIKELRRPFAHFDVSPFDDEPDDSCAVIVENFFDFNEERLAQILKGIDKVKPSISWTLLVPTWWSIQPCNSLARWCIEKKPQIIRILSSSS